MPTGAHQVVDHHRKQAGASGSERRTEEEQRTDFWFPVKSHGWGWGLPVRWQGWLVLLGYLGATFWAVRHFKHQRDVRSVVTFLVVLTVILVVVVYVKGERPARWRWGGK